MSLDTLNPLFLEKPKNGGAAGDSEVTVYEHTHRDAFTNPYWPTIDTPKLTTPQWIGEEGVEAAAARSHSHTVGSCR